MRFKTMFEVITKTIARNPRQTMMILGEPGTAKTAMCFEIAKHFGLPPERVLLFRPSLRESVDLMGIPTTSSGVTEWCPPAEFHNFRKGTGPGLIIWDELPQGVVSMQNAIAGAMLDKVLGPLELDPEVIQIATGNRTQDRAGANRVVTQLGNRCLILDMEVHLDDWCKWAIAHDIDPLLVAFIRNSPDALQDFRADSITNPTCRSWEMVSRSGDPSLPRDVFLQQVTGLVGESRAVEYVGFRDLAAKVVSVDAVLLNPKGEAVPTDPALLFIIAASMAHRATKGNFEGLMQYADRMPREFCVAFVRDAISRHEELKSTNVFTQWAINNSEVFID